MYSCTCSVLIIYFSEPFHIKSYARSRESAAEARTVKRNSLELRYRKSVPLYVVDIAVMLSDTPDVEVVVTIPKEY